MRIEHFQKFHIRCDQRYQFSFIPAFQPGRAESSERAEYAVADKRQKLKRNKVVEALLSEAQHRAEQCQQWQDDPNGCRRDRHVQSQSVQDRVPAENRNELHSQISQRSRYHCQRHKA